MPRNPNKIDYSCSFPQGFEVFTSIQDPGHGGDHLLIVKGNQGRLHDETRDQFTFALRQLDPANLDKDRWSFAQTKDIGHDRDETRQIMVCHNLSWMDTSANRPETTSIRDVRPKPQPEY